MFQQSLILFIQSPWCITGLFLISVRHSTYDLQFLKPKPSILDLIITSNPGNIVDLVHLPPLGLRLFAVAALLSWVIKLQLYNYFRGDYDSLNRLVLQSFRSWHYNVCAYSNCIISHWHLYILKISPDLEKNANVTPILEKGNRLQALNYRLTLQVVKLVELIIKTIVGLS